MFRTYNEETRTFKHDTKEIKAYAVLGVKPNWIQLVVHRPLGNQFAKNSWVVCEEETSHIIFAQPAGLISTDKKAPDRKSAVIHALEKMEKAGKQAVMEAIKTANKTREEVL